MTAIAMRASAADRFLDWAARHELAVSFAGAVFAGLSVFAILQPMPAMSSGCVAPVIASVEMIAPTSLV